MNITGNQMMYGLIILTIGVVSGGIAAYTNADAELSQSEVDAYINAWHVNNGHVFASQEELSDAITVLDKEHHETFDEISANFTSVAKAHQNLMAMVVTEETTDDDTPAAVNKFNLVSDPEWKRGELISITGMLPIKSTLEAILTHETDADYKRTFNVAVFDDRTFTMPFSISSNDPLGDYMVSFKSSGLRDSITFEIVE